MPSGQGRVAAPVSIKTRLSVAIVKKRFNFIGIRGYKLMADSAAHVKHV